MQNSFIAPPNPNVTQEDLQKSLRMYALDTLLVHAGKTLTSEMINDIANELVSRVDDLWRFKSDNAKNEGFKHEPKL